MQESARRRVAATATALGIGAVGIVAGLVAGRGTVAAPTEVPAAGRTSSPAPPAGAPTSGTVEFSDDAAGFALSYPSDWRRLESGDPEVPLVATPNGRDSFLVRIIDLGGRMTEAELPDLKRLTDDLVTSSTGVELLAEPERIELAGLPGYFYFYAFDDAGSGQRGAHSHYFLLDGSRLVTLVFQALPLSRFDDLAPTFDEVAASLRILPEGERDGG